jgi:hypothetical protein
MATPWSTAGSYAISLAQLASFTISAAGTPGTGWTVRFSSGTRWIEGSFGLTGSGSDFIWSLPLWEIGTLVQVGTSNLTVWHGIAEEGKTVTYDVVAIDALGWTFTQSGTEVYDLGVVGLSGVPGGTITLPSNLYQVPAGVTPYFQVLGQSDGTVIVDPTQPVITISGTASITPSYEFVVDLGLGGFEASSGYTVSSTTGTYTRGSTITIQGPVGSFGTKPNGEKPRYFWRFDTNTSTDPTLSRNTFGGSFNGTYQASVKPTGRSGAMTWDIETGYPASANLFTGPKLTWTPSDSSKFYLFLRRRAEYTPQGLSSSQINNKILRLYPENVAAVSDDPSQYVGYASSPRTFVEGVGGGTATFGGPYWTPGQFHTLECQFQQGALNTQDGVFNCILNGRHYLSPSTRWVHRSSTTGETDRFDELNIDQRSNLIDVANSNVYYSDLMFDDSWCRVIYSNETTWNESTSGDYARKLAVVKTWSDTQVTCELLDDMASGDCLYVVKSTGTAVKIGQYRPFEEQPGVAVNWSGSITNGTRLTISGSGFGTGPTYWWFDNIDNIAGYSGYTNGANVPAGVAYSAVQTSSSTPMKFSTVSPRTAYSTRHYRLGTTLSGQYTDGALDGIIAMGGQNPGPEYQPKRFTRIFVRCSEQPPYEEIKWFRFWAANDTNRICSVVCNGMSYTKQDGSAGRKFGAMRPSAGVWTVIEAYVDVDELDTNGKITPKIGNVITSTASAGSNAVTDAWRTASGRGIRMAVIGYDCGSTPAAPLLPTVEIAEIYSATSQARVMLTDNAVWTSVTNGQEVCVPVSWSSSQVVVDLNLGQWSSAEGKHLHLIRDDGTTQYLGRFV